jgi:MFS family permease
MTSTQESVADSVFDRRLRGFTLGILASVGMVAFESLGVATILPTVARDLGGLSAYGWGLSALMLANVVGTVIAGASIDRRGPARTVMVGLLTFAAGCLLAGLAPNWALFIGARAVQGLGVGAIMAFAYSLVGLAYPPGLQAVMFAFLSSAWTIPSLVGQVLAGVVASAADWRIVFWVIAPIMILILPLVLPHARRLNVTQAGSRGSSAAILLSGVLTIGATLLLVGLDLTSVALAAVVTIAGVVVMVVALLRLTPAGTLRAARGAPAGIVIRFLLCAVYFGSEAFLPLGLSTIHGISATPAGVGLAAGALAWVAGSFLQARIDARRPGHRALATTLGFAVLLLGEVLMGTAVALDGMWAGWAVIGWTVGGLGMGVAFNAATTTTMAVSPTEQAGTISSNLQLAQTLATALVAGIGGAVIAHAGTTPKAFLLVFALTAALGLLGTALSHRTQTQPLTS